MSSQGKHILLLLLLGATLAVSAQERVSRSRLLRQAVASKSQNSNMSVRAKHMNEQLTQDEDHSTWKREIYRFIDLTKEINTPLYYPAQASSIDANLFTILFRLMANDEIVAYEYIDGQEIFTDEYIVEFKEFLDRFHVLYEEKRQRGGRVDLTIEDSDIPSSEVKGYYMKEVWFFNAHKSSFEHKIIALCPVLLRAGDFSDEETRYPMFWLKYEDIRPFISKDPVMTSDLNNIKRMTLDDFFRKQMYEGEIYKTTNLMNRSLVQYCPTPDSVKSEQKRIEAEIEAFKNNLWLVDTLSTDPNAKEMTRAQARRAAKKSKRAKAAKSQKSAKYKPANAAGGGGGAAASGGVVSVRPN